MTRLLATQREKVLDLQMQQQRVAWAAIEMFAMAAVISRLQSMLEEAEGNGGNPNLQRDLVVGLGYTRHAGSRVARRLKGLFKNQDRSRLAVADAVLQMPDPASEN